METGNLLVDAQAAFARQRRRRRWRRAGPLTSLQEALGGEPPARRRMAGLQAIALETIVGTAEPAKARVFDNRFRVPESSRRRWERLWIASRKGAALPPISVFRVGEEHFVDDGHHRVSVAQALGMVSIDAEVVDLNT